MFKLIPFSYRLFLWLLLTSPLLAADGDAGRDYINQVRQQAGLQALQHSELYSLAAQNHADYLTNNQAAGHYEEQGRSGFSGKKPDDRVVAVGSDTRHVLENVSVHSEAAEISESVDGLMSAIYHRFAFLSLDANEIGIGQSSNQLQSYVYKLGNSKVQQLCRDPEHTGSGRYYPGLCAQKYFKADGDKFDDLLKQTQLSQAKIVVWPAANSESIPPAFYEESPDPLPHHNVSAYPISVQFNPAYFNNEIPTLRRFELFEQEGNQALEIIKLFNHDNDQHEKFTEYQHAIFPLQRLHWNTSYRVELEYKVNGSRQRLEWEFKTTDLKLPIRVVDQQQQQFRVYSGQPFILSVTPQDQFDGESAYRTRQNSLLDLQIDLIDPHTLKVSMSGSGSAEIKLHGKTVKLTF